LQGERVKKQAPSPINVIQYYNNIEISTILMDSTANKYKKTPSSMEMYFIHNTFEHMLDFT